VVEILRPAQRHFEERDIEAVRSMRPGAPMAPFLAHVYAQENPSDAAAPGAANRYEWVAALATEPSCMCLTTI
jgi:hypothetical protein